MTESTYDSLEIRITKLDLQPGQVLVLQSDELLEDITSGNDDLCNYLVQLFPNNRILVINDEVKLSVIDAKDIPRGGGPREPIIKLTE